ncbi:MAG: hypothetical protein JO128_00380 [Alphaproteobacteria bacterium]|nr:hypothetical protein [Alphaproteobacteria bacterium]
MIIYITADRRAELREPDEFRSFKIVIGGAPGLAALAGIATIDADGKTAWVSRAAVRRLRGPDPPAAWLASFDKMVESVRRFGWVNDETDSVRAHIETVHL